MATRKKKVVAPAAPVLVKLPDWLEGIKVIGDTLVIPSHTFNVRKVTVQDAIDETVVRTSFEVSRKGPTFVASEALPPTHEIFRALAAASPNSGR